MKNTHLQPSISTPSRTTLPRSITDPILHLRQTVVMRLCARSTRISISPPQPFSMCGSGWTLISTFSGISIPDTTPCHPSPRSQKASAPTSYLQPDFHGLLGGLTQANDIPHETLGHPKCCRSLQMSSTPAASFIFFLVRVSNFDTMGAFDKQNPLFTKAQVDAI